MGRKARTPLMRGVGRVVSASEGNCPNLALVARKMAWGMRSIFYATDYT